MKKSLIMFLCIFFTWFISSTLYAAPIYTASDLGTHTTDAVNINLSGLDAHSEITINFDLYILDSWDGNTTTGGTVPPDYFAFSVDGAVYSWTFDNFNYSDETNTDIADAVGNFNSVNNWGAIDRLFIDYNNGFTFAHNSDTLTLSFYGYGAGFQNINDESWRVTNLNVSSSAPVPEPATMMLFGIGLLSLAGVSRRKK